MGALCDHVSALNVTVLTMRKEEEDPHMVHWGWSQPYGQKDTSALVLERSGAKPRERSKEKEEGDGEAIWRF